MLSFPLRRLSMGSAGWWHPAAVFAFHPDRGAFMRRGIQAPLASVAALTRASDHVMADAAGIFQSFGSDTLARADGVGAFAGGAFANKIRNARGEGGTVGTFQPASGGGLPNNMWMNFNATAGLTFQFLGAGVENGLPCFDIRISGTHTGAGGSPDLIFETGTHVPFILGEKCGVNFWVKLLTGVAPAGVSSVVYSFNSSGVSLGGLAGTLVIPTSVIKLVSQQFVITNVLTAFAGGAIRFTGFLKDIAHDATYRIYSPKLIGPMLSAYLPDYPILPPAGAPADTLRAADDLRAASFDWFAEAGLGGGFGFLADVDLTHIGDGVERTILEFSNAAGDERTALAVTVTGTLALTTTKAGVTSTLAESAPALGLGTVRCVARVVDGASRLAVKGRAAINSAAVGIAPTGLDRMRLGARADGTGHLNDLLRQLQVTRPLADMEMDQWAAA